MKHFFVIVNAEKPLAEKTEEAVQNCLRNCDANITVTAWKGPQQAHYALPEDTDCIITIGGDGTLIQAARAVVGTEIPLIGINRGHMGYLTQLAREEDIAPALKRLAAGKYEIERRMMLHAAVYRDGVCLFEDTALNEVMTARHGSLRTLQFSVYVNDTKLNSYSADGIIIATPTGSTAYSLSAGGPIAEPQAALMIMTPVCSHAINARSIILSPNDRIRIVTESEHQLVACDGDVMMRLLPGDEIVIERSEHMTQLVRLSDESFLETLRAKMTFL